jgi:hypothetical protein
MRCTCICIGCCGFKTGLHTAACIHDTLALFLFIRIVRVGGVGGGGWGGVGWGGVGRGGAGRGGRDKKLPPKQMGGRLVQIDYLHILIKAQLA